MNYKNVLGIYQAYIPNEPEYTNVMLSLFRLFSSPILPVYVQYTGKIIELSNKKILRLKASLFKSIGYTN
jgi:hypothetical protein